MLQIRRTGTGGLLRHQADAHALARVPLKLGVRSITPNENPQNILLVIPEYL
jgi:hypothetical protein